MDSRKNNSKKSENPAMDFEVVENENHLNNDQKIIVIQKCLQEPQKLFEKFHKGVSRYSQSLEWENILMDLRKDGINFPNVKTLRKNVTNWTTRATAASDKIRQTGVGVQKPLTEFQQLCLAFLRAAKGSAAVDYIAGVSEPSGSSKIMEPTTLDKSKSESDNVDDNDGDNTSVANHEPKKPKRQTYDEQWKEKYFESFHAIDEARHREERKESSLKRYNILLQNIQLERSLGLDENLITDLRSSIDPELNNYPKFEDVNQFSFNMAIPDENRNTIDE